MPANLAPSQMLSQHETRTHNNFTLLRFIFASAVLIGHSYPISAHGSDPISLLLLPYTWIGDIAVCGFFAISGFLVTGSIVRRGSASFAVSRALRLYPAIIMYSLIAILVIGPLAIDVPVSEYFKANPWNNLWNISLWQWNYNLPYVFADNPLAGSTNGSTWTLPAELRCYILIFFLGLFGIFDSAWRANAFLLTLLALISVDFTALPLFGDSPNFSSPLTFFIVGSLFWVNRHFVPLSWPLAAAAALAPFLAAKFGLYHYIFPPALIYLIFIFVYKLPTFDVDRYGDISYGVYIYAWPIQQLVWRPGQSAVENIGLALLIVLPLAYLSWRLVEKPALKLRKYISTPRKAASVAQDSGAPLPAARSAISALLLAVLVGTVAYLDKNSTPIAPTDNSTTSFYLTDENWINGVARHYAGFFVPNEPLYEKWYIAGAIVQFNDGQERQIAEVRKSGPYLNVFLDGKPLDPKKAGRPNTYSIK